MNPDVPAPELLAPAGSFACLKAAVQSGADAVYLGLKTGSARMGAENFTFEELEQALRYAHIRGVRVYLALNTLFFEETFETGYQTAKKAAQLGVDALILQDLGLAAEIGKSRRDFPCELHASTQMSVYNEEGLHFLKNLGFDRCIAARELSLAEIAQLCSAGIMDVEVFCHGALCMSISGQCLLSSFIGGRSGNRGECAQPCRRKYALSEGGLSTPYAYRLSPADFASLPWLRQLAGTGAGSLKIEGRLKSPAYVAAVTRYYRQALDGSVADIPEKLTELRLLFGRGDFTSGYLFGKLPAGDITFRSAGRLGLPCGRLKEFPIRLPVPDTLPQRLTRFRFSVRFDSDARPLKAGDGVTIYDAGETEYKAAGGGTVNSVKKGKTPQTADITAVGTLGARGKGPYLLFLTDDPALRERAEQTLTSESKKIPVRMLFSARSGEKPSLQMEDADGTLALAQAAVPAARAQHAPATEESVRKQLTKLGDTPYSVETLQIDLEPDLFLPVSVLNTLRRDCAGQLSEMRAAKRTAAVGTPVIYKKSASPAEGGLSFFFYQAERFFSFGEDDVPEALRPYRSEPRTFYLPMDSFYDPAPDFLSRMENRIAALRRAGVCKIVLYFPFVSLGEAWAEARKQLPLLLKRWAGSLIDGFLCENPGDLVYLQEAQQAHAKELLTCCDYSLNAVNSRTLRCLGDLGVNRAALSPEASAACLRAAASAVNPEVVVQGRLVLMRSRHCYIDEGQCGGKKKKCLNGRFSLKDEYGCEFPILPQRRDCCSILLSHRPLEAAPAQIKKIRSVCPQATLRVNLE